MAEQYYICHIVRVQAQIRVDLCHFKRMDIDGIRNIFSFFSVATTQKTQLMSSPRTESIMIDQ